MMERILLIEDDRNIYKALKHFFEKEGFELEVAADGALGLEAFRARKPSLVILDLKLPIVPGHEVCREINRQAPTLPIIILSAATDELDRVLLLELGADDYVTKPFSPRELLARVHAVMRRAHPASAQSQYAFDDISVDFEKMELTRSGKRVPLTRQEFKTMRYFAANPERVISRQELLSEVWGYNCYPTTRTVDNHLLNLRQKLEKDPTNPVHFLTVHGVGYKFAP
jgi:DNA-binding response OmpR family regulator